MKRVLHVLSSLERSGMEMMLLSSYREWLRQGFRCDVVATAKEVGPLAPAMRNAGYGVFHIPFRGKAHYVPNFAMFNDFLALCASGYDIVHIHTEAGAPIFAALAKLAGVRRLALTKHNVFRYTGLLRARKYIERLLIRLMGGRYGMISESVSECELQRFRNPGVRVRNWLDTNHFRPPLKEERQSAREALGLGVEQFALLSVGNCSVVKNHAAILESLPFVTQAVDAVYFHLGREQTDQPERSLSADLGVETKVRFIGSSDDPRAFHWASDLFVMPSLHEGLSIAALEAIASGVPAAFSEVEGLREIAAEARNVRVTSTSAESVASAVIEMAAMDPELRRENARIDSQLIRAKFSIKDGVRSNIENLYSDAECR